MVSSRVLRWRTDFVSTGIVLAPDQRLEDALGGRVSQWQWVPKRAEDADADEDEWGEWVLRAHSPIAAAAVAEPLPEPLKPWVRRMTNEAVDLFNHIEPEAEEVPVFAAAARRLKGELKALI
jgi:hypothetical protein